MKIQYILTGEEVTAARKWMSQIRKEALMCRDYNDIEANRDLYMRARGFAEAMEILGLIEKRSEE